MFSVSPEIWNVLSQASRWLFAFFALMLFFFACAWYRSDRREHRSRFRHLPGAGTVGELVVLSGSDELPPDTWFPVPREGILGSLRSDDLVIPCPGVRSRHLTFSWQDGTGLVVRPCLGCDVLVDGVPVDRQSGAAEAAMVHACSFMPPFPIPTEPSGRPFRALIPEAAPGSRRKRSPAEWLPPFLRPVLPAPAYRSSPSCRPGKPFRSRSPSQRRNLLPCRNPLR